MSIYSNVVGSTCLIDEKTFDLNLMKGQWTAAALSSLFPKTSYEVDNRQIDFLWIHRVLK